MTDLLLRYAPSFGDLGLIDLVQDGKQLKTGDTLATAIIISLFTNRRAKADDKLPSPNSSRAGWWADTFPDTPGDLIGSRLWLLQREKQTQETLNRAREYCTEALEWLTEDGIAQQVLLSLEYDDQVPNRMNIGIQVFKPDLVAETYRFEYAWDELTFLTIPGDELLEYGGGIPGLRGEDDEPFLTEDGQTLWEDAAPTMVTEDLEAITTEDDDHIILD